MDETRVCSGCTVRKPLEAFRNDDGYHRRLCRQCTNRRAEKRRLKIKARKREVKCGNPSARTCTVCGAEKALDHFRLIGKYRRRACNVCVAISERLYRHTEAGKAVQQRYRDAHGRKPEPREKAAARARRYRSTRLGRLAMWIGFRKHWMSKSDDPVKRARWQAEVDQMEAMRSRIRHEQNCEVRTPYVKDFRPRT